MGIRGWIMPIQRYYSAAYGRFNTADPNVTGEIVLVALLRTSYPRWAGSPNSLTSPCYKDAYGNY